MTFRLIQFAVLSGVACVLLEAFRRHGQAERERVLAKNDGRRADTEACKQACDAVLDAAKTQQTKTQQIITRRELMRAHLILAERVMAAPYN